MEGNRYNLEKAQEEAQKLAKKVESGEASSYSEAEKLVEAGNEIDAEVVLLRKQLQETDIGYRVQVERIATALRSDHSDQEAINALAKEYIISHGHYRDWLDLIRIFSQTLPEISSVIISSPEVKTIGASIIAKRISEMEFGYTLRYGSSDGEFNSVKEEESSVAVNKLLEQFSFSNDEISQIIKNTIAIQFGEGSSFSRRRSHKARVVDVMLKHFPLKESDLREAIREGLVKRIQYDYDQHIGYGYLVGDFKAIVEAFPITQEMLLDPEVQKAFEAKSRKTPYDEELVTAGFPLPNEPFLQEATKKNCKRQVLRNLYDFDRGGSYVSDKTFSRGAIVLKRFKEAGADLGADQEIVKTAQKILLSTLKSGYGDPETLVNIKSSVQFSNEFTSSEEYLSAFRSYVIKCLDATGYYSYDSVRKIHKLSKDFEFSKISEDHEIHAKAIKVFTGELKNEKLNEARNFLEIFNIPLQEVLEQIRQEVVLAFQSNKIERVVDLQREFSLSPADIEPCLAKHFFKKVNFEELQEQAELLGVSLNSPFFKEGLNAARIFCKINIPNTYFSGLDLGDLPETEYKRLFEFVRKISPEWQDEQNIAGPFMEGAETLGYRRMLDYINRPGLTRHDALHAFSAIMNLYSSCGLSADKFYGNILSQVAKDDASYDAGTAHHQLNTIALSLQNRNPTEILEEASGYGSIQGLANLAEHFASPANVVASWRNLKKFADLVQLLGQRQTLEKLKSYRESGNIKLAEFAEKLAFHPSGGVEIGVVMQFVENPESFIAREESHAPEAHELKKPSNYTDIPNLDLTAMELRDAYVEGALDRLQAFPSLEMEIAVREKVDIRALVRSALGSRKTGAEPLARDSKKLFSEIGKLLKEVGITVHEYLDGKDVSSEAITKIETLLYNKQFGMPQPKLKERIFRAKVNLKSDPEGVLAGNDTACCMPFGSGKNNVYMFNPITALFTLQLKRGDGYRTIAQSVLTKDKDIKASIPEVIQKLQTQSGNIEDVLPESILEAAPAIIACDNVEVSPNYRQEGSEIETAYRAFFSEYFRRYGTQLGVKTNAVVIGQGYSDSLTHLPSEPNTFAPMAPMGYSDKTGDSVYVLDMSITSPMEARTFEIIEAKVDDAHPERASISTDTRIQPLTFEDSLPVAYLEGKAYRDNQSLMTYLHNMENGLIAKDINNTTKGRPNMSLKYVDESGRTRAYLFAYEGRADVKGDGESESVIYISDLASDKETRMAGGRLIRGFTEMYRKEYIEKGNLIPIYAEAREATSYRIITRQIESIGRDLNIDFKVEELDSYEQEGETMHRVVIQPVLKT